MSLNPKLVAEILRAPDDDAPRLVLADELITAGNPRGELIMAQCALAADERSGGAKKMTKSKRTTLERTVRKLLKAHEMTWTKQVGLGAHICTFHRGFIESVEAHSELAKIDVIARERTPIRSLRIVGAGGFRELLELPLAKRLDSLSLANCESRAPELARLADSAIRSLSIAVDEIGPNEIEAIAKMSKLEELALMSMAITEASVAALSTSGLAPRLTRLDLRTEKIPSGNAVAHVIARSPLTSLRMLHLVQFEIDDEGALALSKAPALANLEFLGLAINAIRERGTRALAASSTLKRLRQLELRFNPIGDSAAAFVDPTRLPSLTHLDLGYTRPSPEVAKQLEARFGKGLIPA